jgi:hypothetical protein
MEDCHHTSTIGLKSYNLILYDMNKHDVENFRCHRSTSNML